jgi:hypothetical protein
LVVPRFSVDELTDDVAVAISRPRGLALNFLVLRRVAHRGERMDGVVGPMLVGPWMFACAADPGAARQSRRRRQ